MCIRRGFVLLGLLAAMSVGCSDSPTSVTTPPTVNDPDPVSEPAPGGSVSESFSAVLTGAQEVPEVRTQASGAATFGLSSDGSTIMYAITVSTIANVTAAHIHIGARGESGHVVVDLFTGTKTGPYNGLLAQGVITEKMLKGGQTIASLIDMINSGRAYVNVHTSRNPDGEIRGQLRAEGV